jgi:hypothetical protein
MEQTIRSLEYTLKDGDVKTNEELVVLIERVMKSLAQVMAHKKERWAEEEKEMGVCPCGCS